MEPRRNSEFYFLSVYSSKPVITYFFALKQEHDHCLHIRITLQSNGKALLNLDQHEKISEVALLKPYYYDKKVWLA
jgi:hypothetical protein